METKDKTPAAPRGAGAAETQAPVREQIAEYLLWRMSLLVGDCGPIDVDTAAARGRRLRRCWSTWRRMYI